MKHKKIIQAEDIYPPEPEINQYLHPTIVMIMACRGQSIHKDPDFNPYEDDEFKEIQIEWDNLKRQQGKYVGRLATEEIK